MSLWLILLLVTLPGTLASIGLGVLLVLSLLERDE